jgi:type I restriction enzyme, S subunit
MKFYNDWKMMKLKDITKKIGSGATPRGGKESYIEEGITFIRSQNVYNHSFSYNGLVYITQEQASKLKNVTIEENDVLLNITGDSVCRCCIVPNKLLPARVNQHVALIRCDENKINPFFLKSYLTTNYMQSYMLSLAKHGGTRAALTKGMIEDLIIPLPSLGEQKRIVSILSLVEQKIELNKEMKKTLEELIRIIFRKWFIDFEFPIDNGENYKTNGGKFINSELGLIPEEWEVDELGSVLSIKHGFAFKSKDFSEEETNLYLLSPGNFKVGGGFKNDKFKYLYENAIFPKEYILEEDDLIVTMTDLSRDGDTLGYPAFVPCGENHSYLHNQRLGKVVLKKHFSKNFLYNLMCTTKYRAFILGGATGTTVKHTAPNRIEGFLYVKPCISILSKFDELTRPFYKYIKNINNEIATLTNIRDTLLPKLMSGEICISDAEEEIKACLQKSS